MYVNKSITSRSTASSSSIGAPGAKGMMNSYFASKGIDLSPTKTTNRNKKFLTSARPPPQKSIQKQISPKILEGIRIYFTRKVDQLKNELISVFQLEKGIVISFHLYKTDNDYFELTERRRLLLYRYYGQGSQFVLLYLNQMHFEHYLPVNICVLNKILQSKSVLPLSTNTGSGRKFLCKSKSMTAGIRLVNSSVKQTETNSTNSLKSSNSSQSSPQSSGALNELSQKIKSFHITDDGEQNIRPISSVYSKSYPQTFVHSCSKDLNPEKSDHS